jgi:hypothetical protein
MVKPSSCLNEYYLGDLPGNLQYSKSMEEIIGANLPENDDTRGYVLCDHSSENLYRVLPQTQSHINWKIILMMKSERENDETWMKAALVNKDTGKIALLTATNNKEHITRSGSRAIKTMDGTWFVGHYRMSAPICFWRELKNRLLY